MSEVVATNSPLLAGFVAESNRIEGIGPPHEVGASYLFLNQDQVSVDGLCRFVQVEAGANLRNRLGMNVRIGSHVPPPGGPDIVIELDGLMVRAINHHSGPFDLHRHFESLHPFMDGNGRAGRILWAWQMIHHNIHPGLELGFLHAWYYQSLAEREDGQ